MIGYYNFTGEAKQEHLDVEFFTDEFAKSRYNDPCSMHLSNLKYHGCIKCMGWRYDFRDVLKRYVYKQHGFWYEVYAPNKTLLRKSTCGKIDKILEVK